MTKREREKNEYTPKVPGCFSLRTSLPLGLVDEQPIGESYSDKKKDTKNTRQDKSAVLDVYLCHDAMPTTTI